MDMRPESFKIDLENICNTLFGKPAPVLYAPGCGFFRNSETQRIKSSGIQFPDGITPVYSEDPNIMTLLENGKTHIKMPRKMGLMSISETAITIKTVRFSVDGAGRFPFFLAFSTAQSRSGRVAERRPVR